jgi:predicted adenine nucleotide alpha hydrolase (AANH) superfamily ATPase
MRLLLHCCCGPCTTGVVDHWRDRGAAVQAWFYNPNIWPEGERRRRKETFARAAEALGVPVASVGAEGSWCDFLLALARGRGRRCEACYRMRLEAAARHAREAGCGAISTTLLISPYQDIEALRRIGEEVAARAGVRFEFADLRGQYRASRERARALKLYQQNYCGCLFSRLERAERRAVRAVGRAKTASTRMSADTRG